MSNQYVYVIRDCVLNKESSQLIIIAVSDDAMKKRYVELLNELQISDQLRLNPKCKAIKLTKDYLCLWEGE